MSTMLHSPEDLNSTACAIQDGPLGQLYIQALDAYGFQRELTIRSNGAEYSIHVYQHPGRREMQNLSLGAGRKFRDALIEQITLYPESLFNAGTEDRPRCEGFVRMCERLHRGEPTSKDII